MSWKQPKSGRFWDSELCITFLFTMYVPSNFLSGFILVCLSLFGWGTQTNGVVNLRVPAGIYHLDFIIWRTIWCFVFCLLFGTPLFTPNNKENFIDNIRYVFSADVGSICAGFTDRVQPSLLVWELLF